MTEITKLLEQKMFRKVQTPLILDHTHAMPFMTTETQHRQVKLQGPSGEMLALRGDSTIALVIGDVLKQLTSEPIHRLFYEESNYSHDFDKRVISEIRQIGVEILSVKADPMDLTNTDAFTEALPLAIAIAQRLCGKHILIEVSNAAGLRQVIETLLKGDRKRLDALIYYLDRKNTREAVKILSDAKIGASAQQVVEKMLTTPRELARYVADIESFESIESLDVFNPIYRWLLNIRPAMGDNTSDSAAFVPLNFDPALTLDKPYYSGETFKIYDTQKHRVLITGGTYSFDTYGVNGCGFSINDGRL